MQKQYDENIQARDNNGVVCFKGELIKTSDLNANKILKSDTQNLFNLVRNIKQLCRSKTTVATQ